MCFLGRSPHVIEPKASLMCQELIRTTIELVSNKGKPETPKNELLHLEWPACVPTFNNTPIVASLCRDLNVGAHFWLKFKSLNLVLMLYTCIGPRLMPLSQSIQ